MMTHYKILNLMDLSDSFQYNINIEKEINKKKSKFIHMYIFNSLYYWLFDVLVLPIYQKVIIMWIIDGSKCSHSWIKSHILASKQHTQILSKLFVSMGFSDKLFLYPFRFKNIYRKTTMFFTRRLREVVKKKR